jgi:subtilisin family serine protease
LEAEGPEKLQGFLRSLIRDGEAAAQKALAPAAQFFSEAGGADLPLAFKMDGDRVQVVIETVSPAGSAEVAARLSGMGVELEARYDRWVQAMVPLGELEALAELPSVWFIRLPVRPFLAQASREVRSEGLAVIGSEAWNEAGIDGDGVEVGIIDSGYFNYKGLLGRELPEADKVVGKSFRQDRDLECRDCSRVAQMHGRAVAEVVHDVAPGASLFLTNFDTDVNFRRAINWMIDQDVDVINTSLGFPSGCFTVEGGIFEPEFAKARESGITWVTAAGNEADMHWEGAWSDPDGDGLHNYTATDEGNTISVVLVEFQYPDGRRVATSLVDLLFSWEAASCRAALEDYEVVVMRDENGKLVALPPWNGSVGQLSDWIWQPGVPIRGIFASEDFDVSRVGDVVKYHIAIRKKRAGAPSARFDLMISCPCRSIQYRSPEGSVSITEPSISPNVVTVGAVHHRVGRCGRSLCTDGTLLFYSSRGPTKDGRTKPDIAAPSHVSTTAFGRWTGDRQQDNFGFTGTSAASPHVAGAAALVVQALTRGSPPTPDDVRDFLKGRAEDAGPPGEDNQYGAGILFLGQPPEQPTMPVIQTIEPAEGLQGSTVQATIIGENLADATEVIFSSSGVSAVIRAGGSETELPIVITIAPDAEPGARTFQVTTPVGTAESGEVVFTVLEAPRIAVEPVSLSFSAVVGEDAPPAQNLSITNVGGGTLQWEASVDVPWLQLGAASGTAPSELAVSVLIEGLEPGSYEGSITITAPDALNSPVVVPVALTVEAPPGELLALKFTKLEFLEPGDWERTLRDGCVVYTNVGDGPSVVRVTLTDGTVQDYEIPAGGEVIVCDDVVHIDTRVRPPEG